MEKEEVLEKLCLMDVGLIAKYTPGSKSVKMGEALDHAEDYGLLYIARLMPESTHLTDVEDMYSRLKGMSESTVVEMVSGKPFITGGCFCDHMGSISFIEDKILKAGGILFDLRNDGCRMMSGEITEKTGISYDDLCKADTQTRVDAAKFITDAMTDDIIGITPEEAKRYHLIPVFAEDRR